VTSEPRFSMYTSTPPEALNNYEKAVYSPAYDIPSLSRDPSYNSRPYVPDLDNFDQSDSKLGDVIDAVCFQIRCLEESACCLSQLIRFLIVSENGRLEQGSMGNATGTGASAILYS
jgi:hypothetical protein